MDDATATITHQPARLPARCADSPPDLSGILPPAPIDALNALHERYREDREKIASMSEIGLGDLGRVFGYFVAGNLPAGQRGLPGHERLFAKEGAIKALDAAYWDRALALTDVYDYMPESSREEWRTHIDQLKTPTFDPEIVEATLAALIAQRPAFLAERVDGIFRGLSGEHLTNRPEGFGKRMIIAHVLARYGGIDTHRAGLIHDLRGVVAKFMGRGEPSYAAMAPLLDAMRRHTGVWHAVDGGALRIRVYKCGTAHLEVHPDMAWRLNAILAHRYPRAIPPAFRTPSRKTRQHPLFSRPLPFPVIELLAADQRYSPEKVFRFGFGAKAKGKSAMDLAREVLRLLGGAEMDGETYCFGYDYLPALREVVMSGCIPDAVAHQYYPTPEPLARRMVEAAAIGPDDRALEPSAGTGHIARLLPAERTLCVEVSGLFCKALAAAGLKAVQADFLAWAKTAPERFERVVMNPPFSDGRAREHLDAARGLLAPGGRLVALLPESMRGKPAPDGWRYEWSEPIDGEFPGVSIRLAMLVAVRNP